MFTLPRKIRFQNKTHGRCVDICVKVHDTNHFSNPSVHILRINLLWEGLEKFRLTQSHKIFGLLYPWWLHFDCWADIQQRTIATSFSIKFNQSVRHRLFWMGLCYLFLVGKSPIFFSSGVLVASLPPEGHPEGYSFTDNMCTLWDLLYFLWPKEKKIYLKSSQCLIPGKGKDIKSFHGNRVMELN